MVYQPPNPVTGLQVEDAKVNAGGISGLWGDERDYNVYSIKDPIKDPTYADNRSWVNDRLRQALMQRDYQLNTDGADLWRQQQSQLAQMLYGAATGAAPSAAEQQMQMGLDANNHAASSTAASVSQFGGNPAAAFKAALMQQAQNNQAAVGQTAALRAGEMATARGQLGQVLDGARSQDMSQANAQLSAAIAQRADRDRYIMELVNMGYTMDQAKYMAEVQQLQFQQSSLAQQEAAKHGINSTNTAQPLQFAQMGVKAIAGGIAGGGAGAAKALAS